jgi:hypothetical protein
MDSDGDAPSHTAYSETNHDVLPSVQVTHDRDLAHVLMSNVSIVARDEHSDRGGVRCPNCSVQRPAGGHVYAYLLTGR